MLRPSRLLAVGGLVAATPRPTEDQRQDRQAGHHGPEEHWAVRGAASCERTDPAADHELRGAQQGRRGAGTVRVGLHRVGADGGDAHPERCAHDDEPRQQECEPGASRPTQPHGHRPQGQEREAPPETDERRAAGADDQADRVRAESQAEQLRGEAVVVLQHERCGRDVRERVANANAPVSTWPTKRRSPSRER